MPIKPGQFMRSDQAKAFVRQHRSPCSDCPWARKSLKGWTGPNATWRWLAVARDYWHPIACHTRKIAARMKHPLQRMGVNLNGHWECAGAAIFRANIKARHYGEHRPLLQLPADTIRVFASPEEFEAHHGEGTGD